MDISDLEVRMIKSCTPLSVKFYKKFTLKVSVMKDCR